MTAFLYVLAWLCLASSCLASLWGFILYFNDTRRGDSALMRSARWGVAAALFFIAARMPVS